MEDENRRNQFEEGAGVYFEETEYYEESTLSTDIDEAQEEWEESLRQLQFLASMVVLPFAGKFIGRKFAYYSKFFLIIKEIEQNDLKELSESRLKKVASNINSSAVWSHYAQYKYPSSNSI